MGTDHLAFMIRESVRAHAVNAAMRWKEGGAWRSMSYAELGDRIQGVAKALVEAGVREGDRVGLYARNAPEWSIADFAILTVRAITVPIYATNTAQQAEHIARDAGLVLLFVGDQGQHENVLSSWPNLPDLRSVVVFDRSVRVSTARSVSFEDFVRTGSASTGEAVLDRRLEGASEADVATIIYTSGTTGDPRGAVLTHANLFHQFRAIDERFEVGARDRSLSFLPLSHAYERTWSYYVFRQGAENVYLADPKEVVTCMPEVRPTAMVSVPRLYEKICAAVLDRVRQGSAPKRAMFHWAMGVGRRYQERRKEAGEVGGLLSVAHRVADRLVLSKLRDVVGGDKNFLSAGGAPLAKEIEEFFFAAGLLVCQGYGLTETSPMVSCNAPGAFKFGTVGRPVLGCEVKIGQEGEILVRGGNVMLGYFGKPAATAEVFEDGWFRTGDLGEVDDEGYLRITGRIKDIIITSQGKNVAPQRIEGMFGSDPFIEHVAVVGDRRPFVAALVVPAFPILERYARESRIAFATRAELVARPEIVAFYERRMRDGSRELATYERIKRFTLLAKEFTQEGGELTPTQKIRRKVVAQKYREEIEAMYASGAPVTAS